MLGQLVCESLRWKVISWVLKGRAYSKMPHKRIDKSVLLKPLSNAPRQDLANCDPTSQLGPLLSCII
jgi:hypothetical protein